MSKPIAGWLALGAVLLAATGCEQKSSAKEEEKLRSSLQKPIRVQDMTPEQRKRVEPFLQMGRQGPPTSNPLAPATPEKK